MKRQAVLFVLLLMGLSFSSCLVPHVSSQPENVRVVNYSWYVDSLGFLVVVGEVQNTGPSTVDLVGVSGTVYTIDGTPQRDSYTQAYVKYLVPQQKAPFYMEFDPTNNFGENWVYLGVDHVVFTIPVAEKTSNYQYPDLVIKTSSKTIDNGVYWVSGTVQNTGTQTAKNIRVIATFFNASGSVVGMGFTGDAPLAPTSLVPSGTVSFKVGAWDLNQTEVPSSLKIYGYSLLIQADEPILSGTPPPPSNSTQTTPTDTSPSSTEPSDTNPNNSDSIPWSTYAIIAIVVVFAIVGSVLLFRQRKSQAEKKRQIQTQKKPRTSKKKRQASQ